MKWVSLCSAMCFLHLSVSLTNVNGGLMGPGAITVRLEDTATLDITQAGAALHGTYSHAGDTRLFLVGRNGE